MTDYMILSSELKKAIWRQYFGDEYLGFLGFRRTVILVILKGFGDKIADFIVSNGIMGRGWTSGG